MSYLRGFLPWIAFSLALSLGWQWAALLALVLSTISLLWDRRAGVRADAQILDFGTVIAFAGLAVFAFLDPRSPLQDYGNVIPSVFLVVIGLVSLAVHQPFVLGIAKRRAAPQVWNTPAFRHMCTVLTVAWTVSFAAGAVGALLCQLGGAAHLFRILVQVFWLVVPITFTHFYVRAVRARGTVGRP